MSDPRPEDERGRRSYWLSVERLLDSPALDLGEGTEAAGRGGTASPLAGSLPSRGEFPPGAEHPPEGVTRRTMLGLMAASFGLAGTAACRRPVEHIVPYVDAPEGLVPGIPERYATTLPLGTGPVGVVVESHEGRPTKVEGNDLHPSSGGAANAWMQAEILDLYDPDRSRRVLRRPSGDPGAAPEPSSWEAFETFWSEAARRAEGGRGLAVLSEGFASPTTARLVRRFAARHPQARFAVWDPLGEENLFAGIERATGTARRPVLHLDRARTILALDADLLLTEAGALANSRGFAAGRRPDRDAADRAAGVDEGGMNRLYAVESALSLTGANADHRIALPSSRVGAFATALAERLGIAAEGPGAAGAAADLPVALAERLDVLAADLEAAGPDALVAAGRRQPPVVHALVHRINERLGAVGRTVTLHDLADVGWGRTAELAELSEAIGAGTVDTLVILGGNPVYDAPGALGFEDALRQVPHSVHLSDRVDETSRACEWHLPRCHPFEAWGDARAGDGTASVAQPLIAPLFDSRSAIEVLALLAGEDATDGASLVRGTWGAGDGSGRAWRRVLHDGVAPEGAGPAPGEPVTVIRPETVATPVEEGAEAPAGGGGDDGMELVLQVSPSVLDGRYANNAWLQELPDPLTRITWNNALFVAPATAAGLGVEPGDMVRVGLAGVGFIDAPAWIAPGQAEGSVALEIGYGRTAAGRVGNGVGVAASPLRGADGSMIVTGVSLRPIGGRVELVQTQEHWAMEGRELVREGSLAEYREHPDFARRPHEPPLVGAATGPGAEAPEPGEAREGSRGGSTPGDSPSAAALPGQGQSLWREPSYGEGPQWGMAIDLSSCTGCNACVVACQAENNIPVVGPEQVRNGREMHWLRVDRYFAGSPEAPETVFQPVPCMHCENAPCEQVCPVAATVHDEEGLNAMVYNRCIGTRYCSNNCPYKVRRFNFFNYTNRTPELVKMAMNPDVTVRSRGVMEKCTYCVQRISRAKADARSGRERGERSLPDGAVVTACQETCPADAIVFGDLADPDSRIAKIKRNPRGYALLGLLNNQPRTTYLAKLRNPNPRWPQEGA